MKILIGFTVACFLSLTSIAGAQQPSITPDGAARALSLVFFVSEICSKYFNIDRDLTTDFALATAKVGNKMAGVKSFSELASVKINRRAKEIDATGSKMWCSYQKPNLDSLGLKAFRD